VGDSLEAQGVDQALVSAADDVIVTSTKSMTGHLLGGAGAVESVAAIMALRDKVAPPTINLEDQDESVPLRIATEPTPLTAPGNAPMAVLNNAFGFGGHNVALVFTEA
jgi:3-oxoacyl-[acyl-carrier-protein] synthase II